MDKDKVIKSVTSYLCRTCDDTGDPDDDFLWVIFEAVANQAKVDAYKEFIKNNVNA